jgi:hypothetical protein
MTTAYEMIVNFYGHIEKFDLPIKHYTGGLDK